MNPPRLAHSTSPKKVVVSSHARNNERILAHRPGQTRPKRAEPTSQVLIRHRGTGQPKDCKRRWGGGQRSASQRHRDRPGCFRTGCVTGALLLKTSDLVPYGTPSQPGELNSAMTWSEAADFAHQKYVTWEDERCATCARELPRYYKDTGIEARAWVDEELEGVFCHVCYRKWKVGVEKVSEKLLADLPPFAAQVIRALIRVAGVLDVPEDQRRHNIIGSLDVDEYEQNPIWKKRRNEFVTSRGPNPRCELCLSANTWTGTQHVPIKVNVHHKTYERTGCELDEDLALLCRTCHLVIHQPSLKESQVQFQKLLRDRDEKTVIDAIAALLPTYGWGPTA